MAFVSEKPTEKYFEGNKLSQLTQLAHYHKNWIKLASTFYVGFSSYCQFYFLKHRKGTHHQEMWANFGQHMLRLKKFYIPIRVYFLCSIVVFLFDCRRCWFEHPRRLLLSFSFLQSSFSFLLVWTSQMSIVVIFLCSIVVFLFDCRRCWFGRPRRPLSLFSFL